MEILVTNPAIRIRPPSKITNQKWLIEDFDSHKSFTMPEIAISILIYCLNPQNKGEVIDEASKFQGLSIQKISALISSLLERKFIINQSNKLSASHTKPLNSEYFYEQYQKWDEYKWGDSAEYHFFTYDYPFLDYTRGGSGWSIANQRMNDYSVNTPDTNRTKIYSENHVRINFPLPFNNTLTELRDSVSAKQDTTLNIDDLALISAFGFAKTTEAPIPWNGVPLMRRTSPSGGSRHPTEGYLIACNIKGLENGIYHIQSSPFCFVALETKCSINPSKLFPEFYHNNSLPEPAAIIILTSIFERNMFRYREPRTFRTIHMDAGHIIGTIELITGHLNINTCTSHLFDEKGIEELIGIDGLSEGAITTIGVFNSSCEKNNVDKY